jgi:hypothetical protein
LGKDLELALVGGDSEQRKKSRMPRCFVEERWQGFHLARACLTILCLSFMLSACGKSIEFAEEVQIIGSDKTIVLERREIFEPMMVRLSLKQAYVRSEVSIVGVKVPTWKERLHPIYFSELPGTTNYILVAIIHDTTGCYERGKPNSPYVAFVAEERGWKEIAVPKVFDGLNANLLLRVENRPPGSQPITRKKTEELNSPRRLPPNEKMIQLSSRYGC